MFVGNASISLYVIDGTFPRGPPEIAGFPLKFLSNFTIEIILLYSSGYLSLKKSFLFFALPKPFEVTL